MKLSLDKEKNLLATHKSSIEQPSHYHATTIETKTKNNNKTINTYVNEKNPPKPLILIDKQQTCKSSLRVSTGCNAHGQRGKEKHFEKKRSAKFSKMVSSFAQRLEAVVVFAARRRCRWRSADACALWRHESISIVHRRTEHVFSRCVAVCVRNRHARQTTPLAASEIDPTRVNVASRIDASTVAFRSLLVVTNSIVCVAVAFRFTADF
jgi:hypothetical protein